MAVTRNKAVFSIDLGSLVQQEQDAASVFRQRYQATVLASFSNRVSTEGLTYADQLSFYKQLLEKETNKAIPDPDFIMTLEKNVGDYTKLARFEKFQADYNASLIAEVSGQKTLTDHISFLQSMLSQAVDPEVKSQLNQALVSAQQDRYTQQKTIIANNVQYALKDKTDTVLSDVLNRVQGTKNDALSRGDQEWASALDVSISTLKAQIATNQIEKSINSFTVNTLTDDNPITKLNKLNTMISNADSSTQVSYNGNTYDSAQAYWESQKNDYLSKGTFASDLQSYYKTIIDGAASKGNENLVSTMKSIRQTLTNLESQVDLAPYKDSLSANNSIIVNYGANTAATNIIDAASTSYDFKLASKQLTDLSQSLGVDMTAAYNSLVRSVASVNVDTSNAIVAAAQDYASANKVSASSQEALNWAMSAVSTRSPSSAATTNPLDIAKQNLTGTTPTVDTTLPSASPTPQGIASDVGRKLGPTEFKNLVGQGLTENDITRVGTDIYLKPTSKFSQVNASVAPDTKTTEGTYAIGSYVKLPNSPTVYKVVSQNQLAPLVEGSQYGYKNVGSWSNEDFKKLTGQDFSTGIQTISTLGGYAATGAPIYSPSQLAFDAAEKARIAEEARAAAANAASQNQNNQQNQQQSSTPPPSSSTPPPSSSNPPPPSSSGGSQGTTYRYKNKYTGNIVTLDYQPTQQQLNDLGYTPV